MLRFQNTSPCARRMTCRHAQAGTPSDTAPFKPHMRLEHGIFTCAKHSQTIRNYQS
ncbi:MAG: hypothetical protein IKY83_01325 [Proteobacteria bacterium]|nr:hypothetical protein [Pseudomonadota bacterium]